MEIIDLVNFERVIGKLIELRKQTIL